MTTAAGAANEGRVREDLLRIGVLAPVIPARPFRSDML